MTAQAIRIKPGQLVIRIGFRLIVGLMAADTIPGQTTDLIVYMTGKAIGLGMGAVQSKSALSGMVKSGLFPGGRIMTGLANIGKTESCMVGILGRLVFRLVAGNAGRVGIGIIGTMTIAAAGQTMGVGQGKSSTVFKHRLLPVAVLRLMTILTIQAEASGLMARFHGAQVGIEMAGFAFR